jgi:LuxR family maltose regulon positive regulatory protein
MALATGQLDLAQRAMEIGAQVAGLDGDLAVLRALHLSRLGHDADARALLVPVLRGATEPLLVTSLLTSWLLESALAARNGQQTVSHDAMLSALEIAGPRHAVRRMLQVAPENIESLNNGRGRFGRHEKFVEEVLGHVETPPVPGAVEGDHAHGDGSVPLLTPRELSLLWDLPSLMTVAEIAEARAVSPNTVKTQLRSLFHKMGVASRRDAVSAGRRYGFL